MFPQEVVKYYWQVDEKDDGEMAIFDLPFFVIVPLHFSWAHGH